MLGASPSNTEFTPPTTLRGGITYTRLRLAGDFVLAAVGALLFWTFHAAIDAVFSPWLSFAGHLVRLVTIPGILRVIALTVVFVAVARITRRRRVEDQLRLFWTAVERAPDGVQLLDADGRVLYSNRAVQDIFGFSPAELRGQHVDETNRDPGFASREILPALASRGRWEGELEVKHKDGHVLPVWLKATVITNEEGKQVALLGVIRDITDRKRALQDVQNYAAQLEAASRFKDLFTDILRHDLLNPVGAISLHTDYGLRKATDEDLRRALGAMKSDLARLTEMIHTASTYAKLEGPELLERRTIDMDVMVRAVIAGFSTQIAARQMRVDYLCERAQAVEAYAVIEDAVANLVSNAIKYSPEGGRVEVLLSGDEQQVRVAVKDWGPGVDPADRPRLFTRFQRADKGAVQGTGLGLAIVKRVVELHRGRTWVDENPEGGSVFGIEFPRAWLESPPDAAPSRRVACS